jgi:hypothetical protein
VPVIGRINRAVRSPARSDGAVNRPYRSQGGSDCQRDRPRQTELPVADGELHLQTALLHGMALSKLEVGAIDSAGIEHF